MDEELLEKFLSGRASDEEAARLRAEVEADPSKLDGLFAAAELERDLREAFARPAARRAFPPKRRSLWPLLAAAAALVAVGLGSYVIFREDPIGEVVRVKGTVLPGAGKVYAGGWLETVGPASGATIRFADGTTADLNGGTKLSRIEKGRLALEAGTLAVETGRPIVVTTPQAEAKVLGTVFKLSIAKDATRLDVKKGVVQITGSGDGKSAVVKADHYAVAARGQEIRVRPLGSLVANMAPNTWLSVPDTKLRGVVADAAKYPKIQGRGGPKSIVSSWSGGAFDTRRNRLVVWGGGTTNYYGNEIYAFRLDDLAWERLTEPTAEPSLGNRQVNGDGTPAGRSTYNGLAYIAHADRFFALGGCVADNRGNVGADLLWTFDFEARRWQNMNPSGTRPRTGVENLCAYDPVGRQVWWFDADRGGLFSYDFGADRWTKHNADSVADRTCAVDAKRRTLVVVGHGEVLAYDLKSPGVPGRKWETRGGEGFISRRRPGLDYDSARDRIVGWAGGAVYALDPDTGAWTSYDAPGAPAPTETGTYGRWRYVPAANAFVLVTDIDENVHFYKPGPR